MDPEKRCGECDNMQCKTIYFKSETVTGYCIILRKQVTDQTVCMM